MAVHLDLKNNEDLQKEVENDDSQGFHILNFYMSLFS